MEVSERVWGQPLVLFCKKAGDDLFVLLTGGDQPHIGSTVLSIAHPGLHSGDASVTTSVINRTGHRDEIPGRAVAEYLARRLGVTVSCACGIHYDKPLSADFSDITQAALRLARQLADQLRKETYP